MFFAFILDVFSRMIVGWQLAAHMRRTLVLDALRMALGLRQPGADFQLVHRSDAGSQYTSIEDTQTLDDHRVLASIGTVRDALDNAMAESPVDSYKTELIADRDWRTRSQLELATVAWVGWYNHDRLHEALGDIPPVEFEQHHHLASLAAALPTDAYNAAAPNGPGPTAAALPPVEMTSYGQPTNGSDQTATRHGLPTGLGQPANGREQVNAPVGCPHSHRRLQLSALNLKDIKTNPT